MPAAGEPGHTPVQAFAAPALVEAAAEAPSSATPPSTPPQMRKGPIQPQKQSEYATTKMTREQKEQREREEKERAAIEGPKRRNQAEEKAIARLRGRGSTTQVAPVPHR